MVWLFADPLSLKNIAIIHV